jgi:hypothetical protein
MPEAFYECVMFGRTGDLDLSPLETLPRLKLINTDAYRWNRDLHAFPYPRGDRGRPGHLAPRPRPSRQPQRATSGSYATVADALEAEAVAWEASAGPESFGATADELRERAFDRPHTP